MELLKALKSSKIAPLPKRIRVFSIFALSFFEKSPNCLDASIAICWAIHFAELDHCSRRRNRSSYHVLQVQCQTPLHLKLLSANEVKIVVKSLKMRETITFCVSLATTGFMTVGFWRGTCFPSAPGPATNCGDGVFLRCS